MRREFGLGDVMVLMFHGYREKDTSKRRVNNCRGEFVQRRNGSHEDEE